MAHYVTNLKNIALSFGMALFIFAAIPSDSMAQRARTDKGKVTVERGKATGAPRTATKGRDSKTKATKSGDSGARAGNTRSKVGDSGARAGDARSNRGDATKGRTSEVSRGAGSSGARGSTARIGSGSNANKAGSGAQGSSGRGEIRGNRSTLKTGAQAPIVVGNGRRASVRYAPQIYVPSKFGRNYRPASRISIHIAWPWQVRFERHWSPRYRYRQVVYVQSSWGGQRRDSRVEMETVYRHQVKYANDDYAVLEIDIQEVALYEDGRYVGAVHQIPSSLSKIEATVYRDGRVDFDRDVFIVGDSHAGFEMISTRFYDDYAMARYRDSDGLKAGKLNLRSGKVSRMSRSRLFNPRNFNGFAPISLLPEEEGWLWDYGVDAISAVSDDYDSYYGYNGESARGFKSNSPLSTDSRYSYKTDFGATFDVDRKSNIQRVE